MCVITKFTIPADAFALQQTFETLPGVTVEVLAGDRRPKGRCPPSLR